MSLSRVYRGLDAEALAPVRFRQFGPGGETPEPAADASRQERFTPAPAAATSGPAPAAEPDGGEETARQLEEAYSRGRRDARAEGEEQLGRAADALARALEDISRLRESLLKNSTQDMLNLILVIARQILQTELALNPNVILETLEHALEAAVRTDSYHVRVNPEDLATVEARKPLFLARIKGLRNITFSPDPDLARGGCRVESEFGEVDATIESQFEVIRNTLCNAMEGGE